MINKIKNFYINLLYKLLFLITSICDKLLLNLLKLNKLDSTSDPAKNYLNKLMDLWAPLPKSDFDKVYELFNPVDRSTIQQMSDKVSYLTKKLLSEGHVGIIKNMSYNQINNHKNLPTETLSPKEDSIISLLETFEKQNNLLQSTANKITETNVKLPIKITKKPSNKVKKKSNKKMIKKSVKKPLKKK